MTPQQKRDWINAEVDRRGIADVLLADGHDAAIAGLLVKPEGGAAVAYSVSQVIASLVADGMSEDEAEEYFSFNIAGAYVGPGTPVFIAETAANV